MNKCHWLLSNDIDIEKINEFNTFIKELNKEIIEKYGVKEKKSEDKPISRSYFKYSLDYNKMRKIINNKFKEKYPQLNEHKIYNRLNYCDNQYCWSHEIYFLSMDTQGYPIKLNSQLKSRIVKRRKPSKNKTPKKKSWCTVVSYTYVYAVEHDAEFKYNATEDLTDINNLKNKELLQKYNKIHYMKTKNYVIAEELTGKNSFEQFKNYYRNNK